MKTYRNSILVFTLQCLLIAQHFNSPLDVATSGAYLGGRLGTHVIHSNPALLGISPGEVMETILVDTFDLSYSVRLASTGEEKELVGMKDKLLRDGFEREYNIIKEDTLFLLKASGFHDSFSAYNFSTNLPSSLSKNKILTDTTWKTIEKPKIQYSVQVLATPSQDSLKLFKQRIKKKLKGIDTKVVFKDSLFKYYVGLMDLEEDAITLKDSSIIQSIAEDAFVVKYIAQTLDGAIPKFSITLPIRFVLNMKSNVISAHFINRYINADMVENPGLKTNLLTDIPSSGISGYFGMNSGSLDMTIGNYGISLLNMDIHLQHNIPKPFTEVIFNGIRFENPIEISDFDLRALIVNSTTFSFGRKVNIKDIPFPIYFGAGLRYLTGLFSYIESFEGQITTKKDSVNILIDTKMIYNGIGFSNPYLVEPSQRASGYGLDLGIYGKINEKISAQLSFIGIGGSLNSNQTKIRNSINQIQLSNDDITKLFDYNETQMDSIENTFSILDEKKTGEGTSVAVPSRFNLAVSYIFSNDLHLKAAFQHLMQTDFIGSVNPRFSMGMELFPEKSFPILCGVSFGGINGFTLGAGFGIEVGKVRINLAGSQSGGLVNSATGFSLSSEMRLVF